MAEKNSAPQKHAKKSHLPVVFSSTSGSPPPDTNADLCYIDKLPNEILQKIFQELTIQTVVQLDSDYNSPYQSYLNCRLVSSHWKSGMDTVLEANAFSNWKKMRIPISDRDILTEPPRPGKLIVLKTEEWFDPTEWAYLPLQLETAGDNANPFPSRTLEITSIKEVSVFLYCKPSRGSQLIQFIPFFSKFGHHLTILIIKSLTLIPETFQGILENIPNLKALTLIRVKFRMDLSECVRLPALEKLLYLRILEVESATINQYGYVHDEDERKQLYQWIISPYKKQLLTLHTDGLGEAGHLSEFPALETLVVTGLDKPNFVEPRIFSNPPLKCLCLTKLDIKSEDRIQWMLRICRIISPFAESLSDLYLDFSRNIHRQLVVKGPLFKVPSKTAREKIKTVSFLEMRTLVFPFPANPEEVRAIKEMLKWFPNLEALTFLVAWRIPNSFVSIQDCKRPLLDAQKDVEQEEYWKVCPKLKKIKTEYV